MASIGSRPHGGPVDPESRDIGTLFRSEVWWREHYDDIKLCGYQLRPRYRPGWVPSWRESNKDFFSVEDGQPCLVSAVLLVVLHCPTVLVTGLNGCYTSARWQASHAKEGSPRRGAL